MMTSPSLGFVFRAFDPDAKLFLRRPGGTIPTDKQFTGQSLDSTGLYYYNARYYDATIGRFISADTIVPDWTNPQSLNRYSYVLNNPLRYNDPTGHDGYEPPPPGYLPPPKRSISYSPAPNAVLAFVCIYYPVRHISVNFCLAICFLS